MPDSSSAPSSRSPGAVERDETGTFAPIQVGGIVWPVLLSLLVLGVIGYFTFDPSTLRALPRLFNPWLLGLAAGMTAAQLLLGGWRLNHVAHGRLGFAGSVRAQLAWHFFSNVTPSAIGGGPIAALYIARDQENITVGEATAFMLFTMLLDQFWSIVLIPALLIGALYIDIIPSAAGVVGTWTLAACFVGLLIWSVLFAYTVLFRPDLLHHLADRLFSLKLLRRFRERVLREMSQLGRRARTLRAQSFSFYLKGFLLTAGVWVARYALVLFVMWSVHLDFSKGLAFLRAAAMMLVSLVMPTPGGSGGLEGLYALFMGPLLPNALMAPTLLIWRFLGYYIFIALGVYLSAHHAQKAIRRHQAPAIGSDGAPADETTPEPEPADHAS